MSEPWQLVRDLDARDQILKVLARLAHGVDRLDRAMIISCYHPDAVDDHGSFSGSREDFADWVIQRHTGNIQSCMHLIGNPYIELDGDEARCESYVLASYRFEREGVLYDMTAPGRYLDRFALRDGEWKIVHRLVLFEKDRIDRVEEISKGPLTEMLTKSRRDSRDPAYAFFGRHGF